MYDLSKMPEKFADWPPEARVEHLAYRFMKTPFTNAIDEMLEHLYWPAGLEPEGEGCFIVGDTGVGKTTAVRMFTDRKYAEMRAKDPSGKWYRPKLFATDLSPICHMTPEGLRRPIAAVWVDPRPRFNSFMADTALGLGIDLGSRFSFGKACIEIANAIEKQEVKMIIFDDVQHIIENGMDIYGVADVFKVFAKARVQVVCVGMPDALKLGDENEQLERLVANSYTVQPLRCSVGDFPRLDDNGRLLVRTERQELTPYRKLLRALDRRNGKNSVLPFDEPSDLSGKMMKLVVRAAKLAIARGNSRITMKHFEEAYRSASKCSDERNWFRMPLPQVRDVFGTVVPLAPVRDEEDEDPAPKSRSMTGKGGGKRKSAMSDGDRRMVEDAFAGRK
ncbi:hypothetical protein ACVI1J_004903 [Bradyrhizobium diazoefficiens]